MNIPRIFLQLPLVIGEVKYGHLTRIDGGSAKERIFTRGNFNFFGFNVKIWVTVVVIGEDRIFSTINVISLVARHVLAFNKEFQIT